MRTASSTSRVRRRLAIALGLLLAFTLFGFFVAPLIVKSQLEQRGSALLGRSVTVGKVRVNPYAMSVTLEGLNVALKDGTGSFLGWERLYVNADPLSSIFGKWKLGAIELDGFHVAAVLHADGSFNFADILEKLTELRKADAPESKPRAIEVDSLVVDGARVDFSDESRNKPFATTLGPLTFGLTDFRTRGAADAPYHFEAATEAGEKLVWTGSLNADPISSKGRFQLENIVLSKYLAYYADRLQADRIEGRLSVQGHYELNLAEAGRAMKLSDGGVQLHEVKVWAAGDTDPAVELPLVEVTGIQADALALKATVAAVAVKGGHARVRRAPDGSLNLFALLPPPTPTPPTAMAPSAGTPPTPAKLPDFLVKEISVKDFQADLTDQAAPRPAQLGLSGIQISLRDVTLANDATIPVQLALNWAPQGTVKVAGTLALIPGLKADLKTEVTGLGLLPLSPYVEQFINARLTQGAVNASGTVQVSLSDGVPAITFEGDVALDQLGLVDGAHSEELAGFGSLKLTGIKAATAPALALAVDSAAVTAPYARVLVNPDKSLNLATLAKKAPSKEEGNVPIPAPAPPSKEGKSLPNIAIGQVTVSDGNFSLTDRSLEPHVRLAVTQFGGTIAGLSSENVARATVDLKASVDGAGAITINGQLDPLGVRKFVDLTVDFKNVDLLPLSPYSGKFAGYELARGKLALDVKLKLDDKRLDASNVITLNQFTFGSAVASPEATTLPVRLGVALLKDMNGQIVIDVPMAGNIDDPELRIGKVVMRVVVNLLTKAAVSPFALLGSMFGGGGDELAYQEFVPGGSELQPAELKKLDTMVKALTNRPGLSVAMEGGYDGPADTYALKQQKFAALVRNRIWEERHAIDPNIPPPEQLQIAPEAHAAKVKQLFEEKFAAGTDLGETPAAAPTVVARPEEPRKSILGRVVDIITFKRAREATDSPTEVTAPDQSTPAEVPVSGPSLEEMVARLADTMTVDDNDLRALADARAQRVRDYFLNQGKIAADRLFLAKGNEAVEAKQGPRVFLSLQ